MNLIKFLLKKIYLKTIDLLWISFKSARIIIGPTSCRFYPSCSVYSKQAFTKYNPVKAAVLSIIRILRCNPFSKGGYDPLK